MDNPSNEQDARRLSELFDIDNSVRFPWSPGELGDVLHHQLQASIVDDLDRLDPELAARFREVTRGMHAAPVTFGDVFCGEQPPAEILRLVKDYAKASRDAEAWLPEEIASVLYHGSIALALAVHGERITSRDTTQVQRGAEWIVRQPWQDPSIRRRIEAVLPSL